jgi:hypothetical protein
MERVHPGAIVRQALFMLMAASGSAGLSNTYPVLRRIVLDQERLELPEPMSLRLSLVATRRIRLFPVVGEADFDAGVERALVEVAHMPFAWLAEIGSLSNKRTSPIVSDWTQYDPAEERQISLTLPLGVLTTAAPADYRHPWEVEAGAVVQPDEESP